jgi:rhodanese-related sulfurtransferase
MTLPRRFLLAAPLLAPAAAQAFPWRSGLPDPSDPRTSLDAVERAVARLIPVAEITPRALAARLGEVVLFDVREAEEHAMSRLPGAIRLDPGMAAAAFRATHGTAVTGREVAFYCAVGWRSGRLLERVGPLLAAAPPAQAWNLRGGVFRWRAEGLPLEGGAEVHHFDQGWGRLLARTLAG